MKLSVALIARDEAELIPGCLESIKDADEIVVVDTGSTDNTIEIARDYTDEVYEVEWRDDFAAARNHAKALCTGDWVYSIDADHVNATPIATIKDEIDRIANEHRVAAVDLDGHHKAAWLFANDPDLLWQGRVHEVLNEPATVEVDVQQTTRPTGRVNTQRNIRILQKEEDSPRTRFYLGREYFELGDYAKAVDWLIHYLKDPAFPAEQAEAWLTMAKCYWQLQEGAKARAACLQAIGMNPDFTEALSFMADITFEPWSSKWQLIAFNSTNQDVLFTRNAQRSAKISS